MVSIEFRDVEDRVEIPKAKQLLIGGKQMGEAMPSINGDRLSWHSIIHLETTAVVGCLVQGHGNSPRDAIARSIVRARKDRDSFAEQLAWLENELGTTGKSADELLKIEA